MSQDLLGFALAGSYIRQNKRAKKAERCNLLHRSAFLFRPISVFYCDARRSRPSDPTKQQKRSPFGDREELGGGVEPIISAYWRYMNDRRNHLFICRYHSK
jgi:hypothetical protein